MTTLSAAYLIVVGATQCLVFAK